MEEIRHSRRPVVGNTPAPCWSRHATIYENHLGLFFVKKKDF